MLKSAYTLGGKKERFQERNGCCNGIKLFLFTPQKICGVFTQEGIAGQFGIFQWNLLESFQLLFKFAGLLPLPSRQRRGRQIHASGIL